MTGNKALAYKGPGKVELNDIDYPSFELKVGPGVNPANVGRSVRHGAILKTVATDICGSGQHMVRGRTAAPADLVLGHENTGEVVEVGPDVEFIKVGDICSVPFNLACGRCRNDNAKAIPLEDAPKGHAEFDAGAARKYVLNPNRHLS
jgi:glutathione-independent formaldehyde dehydrogenase